MKSSTSFDFLGLRIFIFKENLLIYDSKIPKFFTFLIIFQSAVVSPIFSAVLHFEKYQDCCKILTKPYSEIIGIHPKLDLRTTRFNDLLDLRTKTRLPIYFTKYQLVMIYPGPGSETWVPISLRCGYPGTRVPIYNLKVV